jgi:hypothetical protein
MDPVDVGLHRRCSDNCVDIQCQLRFFIRTALGCGADKQFNKVGRWWLVLCRIRELRLVAKQRSFHTTSGRRAPYFVFFTAAQLFVYQIHAGFPSLIASSSSSASDLYDQRFCFWGMADKNVFGARIALFGFLYLLSFFIRRRRFPIWRTLIVLLCAFLSGSRTPMAALFIGICYVLYRTSRIKGRLALGTFVAVISPFALLRLIRIDTIFEPSDGMGVRIIYWSTFIQHFRTLSAFGSGFMSAHKFLGAYSPLYLGEPHLHNIFLNNYLDFGLPGFVTYLGFMISFYLFCKRDSPVWFRWYWTSAFLPLVALMLTLSTEYDSDTFVYLSFIYIIGHCTRDAQFVRKVKFSAIPPRTVATSALLAFRGPRPARTT